MESAWVGECAFVRVHSWAQVDGDGLLAVGWWVDLGLHGPWAGKCGLYVIGC